MAIALVRENGHGGVTNGDGTLTTSVSLPILTGATAGNTVFLFFSTNDTADAQGNYTITDSKGNTWTIDAFITNAGGVTVWIASTHQNAGALTNTDHITVAAANGFDVANYWIEEFNGLLTASSPVDKKATNTGSAASGPTGTTAVTTQVNEVALAFCGVKANGALTKDAAYTAFATGSQGLTDPGGITNKVSGFPTYKILAATGTQSATYTFTSANFAACIVTYKANVQNVAPTGIPTGEAWGPSDKLTRLLQSVGAIASAEAWGLANVRRLLSPTGIASREAWGNADKIGRVLAPVGISSAETFGAGDRIAMVVAPVGIASREAFGLPNLVRALRATSIASAEAWGVPLISRASTAQGTQVFVSDVPRGSTCVTDAALRFVKVSDRLVDSVDVSEG